MYKIGCFLNQNKENVLPTYEVNLKKMIECSLQPKNKDKKNEAILGFYF